MQHGEEVRAGEELGAGGLQQQRETRARAGGRHRTVPPVLCNRRGDRQSKCVCVCVCVCVLERKREREKKREKGRKKVRRDPPDSQSVCVLETKRERKRERERERKKERK